MGRGVNGRYPAPKSSCVCIPCFKSVAPWVLSVPFLAFFGPDMKREMGVVINMHLKHAPDCIDSKCIWVLGFPKFKFFC